MAYFNPYYNQDRGPQPYDVPGYYRYNTPTMDTSVNIPQYRPRGSQSMQTPGLSMMDNRQQPQNTSQLGNIAQGVVGAAGLFSQWKSMGDEADQVQTDAPGLQYDYTGRPTYNQGQFAQSIQGMSAKGAGAGEILGSAGTGAVIGSQIMPGIGTAIGAGIGAIGSIFGGARRKRKMRAAKRRAQKSLENRQAQYNTSTENFAAQEASKAQYYQSLNNTNRLYNLYNT